MWDKLLFFFDKLVEKNIIDFLFNKGERRTELTPRAKFQIFSLFLAWIERKSTRVFTNLVTANGFVKNSVVISVDSD